MSSDAPRWSTTLDVDVASRRTSRGRIEAAVAGDGPAVLLIHGTPGSWRQCIALAEDLDGFRSVLPSRPGYGRTPLRVGRSYDEQADAFVALLDAIGIEKCAVVGISGGGPVAIAMASRHHERVTALVMACAMVPHLMTAPLGMRLVKVRGLAELLAAPIRARGRRQIGRPAVVEAHLRKGLTAAEYARLSTDPRIRDDLVRHELSHLEAPPGLAGLRNDLAQAERARKHGAPTYDVRCPTLLLYGEADTVIPIEHAGFYAAAVPHAERVVFEAAGHVFAFTRRRESSTAIRDLLTRSAV